MQTQNTDILVILMFMIFVLGITYLVYKGKKKTDIKKIDKMGTLKNIKLYSGEGVLIKSYDGVYIERWDTKIYNLYAKKGGEHIIKLEIGENMLLTSENVKV